MKLYIFRHGQTEANITNFIQGNVDLYGLNDTGRLEAAKLSQELSTAKLPIIYSSPLSRAKETAEIVAAANGAVIKIVEGLHEVDMGKADGMYEDDAIEKLAKTNYIVTRLSENSSIQLYDKNFNQLCDMANAIIDTEDTYVKVYNDTETKYFDLEGNEIQNTDALPDNQIYAKSQDGKWGFVDKSGNVVVDYIYDKATDLNVYGYAGILLDGKWGVVNSQGEVIVEPTYTFNARTEPEFIKEYYKVEYGYGEFYFTK